MYIQFFVLTMLWMGIVFGTLEIESGERFLNYDNPLEGYVHEESYVPEVIMKALIIVGTKFVFLGTVIAGWVYPFGIPVAVVISIMSILRLEWVLYPFLFIYVLRDERRCKNG